MTHVAHVTVHFDAVVYQTERAYFVDVGGECVWLPKSLVYDFDEKAGECDVAEFFAIEKGLV